MALLEDMGKMTAWLGQRGRKSLMTTVVAALFLLNLSGALAADGDSVWHGPDLAAARSCPLASIGGCVWYDDNGNGVLDQGEGGLEGVTVYLYRDSGGLVGTQTSAQDGNYRFGDLSAGDYIVQVPETVTLGLAQYALTTDNPLSISLGEGEAYNGADFGYEALASPAEPTAVSLSSFTASPGLTSSASQSVFFPWPWLVALSALAMGRVLWARRRTG